MSPLRQCLVLKGCKICHSVILRHCQQMCICICELWHLYGSITGQCVIDFILCETAGWTVPKANFALETIKYILSYFKLF